MGIRHHNQTHVYVVAQADGCAVKIGVAKDVRKRLAGLQNGNPQRLSVVHLTICASREIATQVEYRAHTHLAECRCEGEWFACPVDEAIAAVSRAVVYVRNRRCNVGYNKTIRRRRDLGSLRQAAGGQYV